MSNINKKKLYEILSVIILFIMFIIMCIYAGKQCFWSDELDWTIDFFAKNNVVDMIKALLEAGYNLPLYYLVMFPIYKIMPYGEIWLLLPNFIAIIAGIYTIKKIAEKIGGQELGFASLCISATSFVLINYGAFELRPYAFLFCFSAIVLYRFICKLELNNTKNNILYAISLILLAYTHWFGCLIIVFYFLVEAFMWIKKKIKISFIIPYITLGILFLPWFIIMMTAHTNNFNEYWATTPSIRSLFQAVAYLLSNNLICYALLGISAIILIIYFLRKKEVKNEFWRYIRIGLGSIIWVMLTIFIYSRYINPQGSLFVNRYFICLLPIIFIIIAIPIAEIIKIRNIHNIKINEFMAMLIAIGIIAIVGILNYYKLHSTCNKYFEPYREVSNFISSDEKANQENTALLTSTGTGYLTYYFEKQGKELPNNVFEGNIDTELFRIVNNGKRIEEEHIEKEELLKYDTLYLFEVHSEFNEEIYNFIKENYKLVETNKEWNFSIYELKNN